MPAAAKLDSAIGTVVAGLLRIRCLPVHAAIQLQLQYRSGGCSLPTMTRRLLHACLSRLSTLPRCMERMAAWASAPRQAVRVAFGADIAAVHHSVAGLWQLGVCAGANGVCASADGDRMLAMDEVLALRPLVHAEVVSCLDSLSWQLLDSGVL